MTEKHRLAASQRPADPKQKADEQVYLDHGVESLVAEDSPDDSELGSPKMSPHSAGTIRKDRA